MARLRDRGSETAGGLLCSSAMRFAFALLVLLSAGCIDPGNEFPDGEQDAEPLDDASTGKPADATPPEPTLGDAMLADATLPDATLPDATLPDATPLDATLPDATAPDATAPDATLPDATLPDATLPDADVSSDPCRGGSIGLASEARADLQIGDWVELSVPIVSKVVALETTLIVPAQPDEVGTLFLWPGLQPHPGGQSFMPIDNGVLQPVLTWGPTCAPFSPAVPYDSWWVSGQYVNPGTSVIDRKGCLGGEGIAVAPGDALRMELRLAGTVWKQSVTNLSNMQRATFDLDLRGQAQNRVIFVIEPYNDVTPIVDVVFTNTVITLESPAAGACAPIVRGDVDSFSAPRTSQDGTRCCIDEITLSAPGFSPG